MKKAVAYIDLLGFSKLVEQSLGDAVVVIANANTILSQHIFEKKIHPSSGYPDEIKEYAKDTSVESIEDYLPFSDSVFLTSSNCDDFVMQLGSFVRKCYTLTAGHYIHPKDPLDPTKESIPNIIVNDDGSPSIKEIDSHLPPTLFRGGISYGEVENLTPMGIVGGQEMKMNTLAGEAVVKAVRLEESVRVKGPRLVFDNSLYSQLSEKTKKYCRQVPERPDLYEILWPMTSYISTNPYTGALTDFNEMFNSAYNLWIPHKDNPEVGLHYIKFMEIIIVSTIRAYDLFWDKKDNVVKKLIDFLEGKGIRELFDYVLMPV